MTVPENNNKPKPPKEIYPVPEPVENEQTDTKPRKARIYSHRRDFKPIILFFIIMIFGIKPQFAQINTELSFKAEYSDNIFQLSDYDLRRWEEYHSSLDFAKTTDDLTLSTQINLAYPIEYRWWTFTPSLTAKLSQSINAKDKHRSDAIFKFRADRYYWSASVLYGYYPQNYYRHFIADGSGKLEKYSYQRNLYKGEAIVRPMKKLSLHGNLSYEDLYYNEHFTKADGHRFSSEIGARYSFAPLTLSGSYGFKDFKNTGYKALNADDGSYQSDIYKGTLRLKAMPLKGESTKEQSWQPYLSLSREDRFYQGNNDWYGGREYHIYSTNAGLNLKLKPHLNLILDYTHIYRNVDSPNASVLRLKEFNENRISTTINYKF